MGFKCGIIGLPNVGKSTIFNALTAQQVDASNYPFCTIEPNVGIIPLQDDRLEKIGELTGSRKITPTTLEFVDIAGLVKGASKGEGLGNQFLNHIQAVDALAHVVRCFDDPNVAHTSAELDPVSDIDVIHTELILKDIEIIDRRLEKDRKLARTGDKDYKKHVDLLEHIVQRLNENVQIKHMGLAESDLVLLSELNLITIKPSFYIANIDEGHLHDNRYIAAISDYVHQFDEPVVAFCGKAQAEISQLDPESRILFLQELGLDEVGFTKVVKVGYKVLNLITFFTANENEARAWTIPYGTLVHRAAGKIHSDFEKGFIRAEVIKFEDLVRYGSEHALRESGKIAVHGRDYVVQEGDLIFFIQAPAR
ncbi:redox-regulated ATPase YchF [candidate division KSB1 bacterium]|nr:redox-regulated ATPase YchF [candidate division KSB1 bacterium]